MNRLGKISGTAIGGRDRSGLGAEWRAALGDTTRAMLDADARIFAGRPEARIDVAAAAHGSTLIDRDGREILDFDGGGMHTLGHAHPRVLAAVERQLGALSYAPPGYTNPAALALAQRLAELVPGNLDRVSFAASNATAISAALKLARAASGRHRVLVTGDSLDRSGPPPLGVEHLPSLDLMAWGGSSARGHEHLAELIDTVLSRAGDFAAVLAEPMAWATCGLPPAGFWASVRSSCDRTGTLLIFDETPSAAGRTGTMFFAEQAGVVPDVLVLGAGLGAGIVPLAAVLSQRQMAPDLDLGSDRNPLGAAAALAMLEVIAEDDLLERATGLGHRGLDHLREIVGRHAVFGEARGVGMTLGVDIAEPTDERAARLRYGCLERGLNVRIGAGRVVLLTPPLTVTVPEIEQAFLIFRPPQATADGARVPAKHRSSHGGWAARTPPFPR